MAGYQQQFHFGVGLHACDNFVVQFLLAFRTDHSLVEIKQGFSLECDFYSRGFRTGYGYRCSGFRRLFLRLFLLRHQIRVAFGGRHGRSPVAGAPALIVVVLDHVAAGVDQVAGIGYVVRESSADGGNASCKREA